MKFLVDNHPPGALVTYLRKKGLDCEHVLEAGLAEASDANLCEYATTNGRIIITKDGFDVSTSEWLSSIYTNCGWFPSRCSLIASCTVISRHAPFSHIEPLSHVNAKALC